MSREPDQPRRAQRDLRLTVHQPSFQANVMPSAIELCQSSAKFEVLAVGGGENVLQCFEFLAVAAPLFFHLCGQARIALVLEVSSALDGPEAGTDPALRSSVIFDRSVGVL